MRRIEWIDTAKGMGIFLVVLGHALPGRALSATVIWAFHMPLFFFLSGLTAKSWSPGAAPALARGVKSLVVPYLFFSLVSIALFMLAHKPGLPANGWGSQLRQMAYGVAGPDGQMLYNVPLWFFTCLVSVRLVFAALTSVLRSKLALFASVVMLAAIAHLLVLPTFTSIAWNLDVALVALVFFSAGHAMQGSKLMPPDLPGMRRWTALVVAILSLAAAVVMNGRVDMNGRTFGNPAWFYLGAFAGIALMAELARLLAGIEFLKSLSRASIVIFPVHAMFWLLPYKVFSAIEWYVSKIAHSDLLVATVTAVLEIGLCLPVYVAIREWAPFLIGQSTRPVTLFSHPDSPPAG